MSHVFISYSHEDGTSYLKQLRTYLESKNFDEDIWVDQSGIETGSNWRDSIDTALEESSVVIVVVTPAALKSHYVTYEWAWAVGYGINVVPLLFQSPKDQIANPLERTQYINCEANNNHIPDDLINTIRAKSKLSTLEYYLGEKIGDLLLPLRVFSRLVVWLYPYSRNGVVQPTEFHNLVKKAEDEARSLYRSLMPEFWFNRASVFSRKQQRTYRELNERLHHFHDKLSNLVDETQYMYPNIDYSPLIKGIDDYRMASIEPLINYFLPNRVDYAGFESYLQSFPNNEPSGLLYKELTLRELSEEAANNIRSLIDKILVHNQQAQNDN
jgi:hypothetical protein